MDMTFINELIDFAIALIEKLEDFFASIVVKKGFEDGTKYYPEA